MSRSAHVSGRQSQPARSETRGTGRDAREPSFAVAELVFLARVREIYSSAFGSCEDFAPQAA
jgi:hypothetical protein